MGSEAPLRQATRGERPPEPGGLMPVSGRVGHSVTVHGGAFNDNFVALQAFMTLVA